MVDLFEETGFIFADVSRNTTLEAEYLARDLMTGYLIVRGDDAFEISEAEVYMDVDPYTHGAPRQKEPPGTYYVHRSSTKPSSKYRGGSFKGLDIVFGPEGYAGGILIREIRNLRKGETVSGPCKVAEALINCIGGEVTFPEAAARVEEEPAYAQTPLERK